MKSFGNNVFVKIIDEEKKGLISYEEVKKYLVAKVLSVGDKVEYLKEGDDIVINKDYNVIPYDEDEKTYFVADKCILGKL